jgi:hypothetical protein
MPLLKLTLIPCRHGTSPILDSVAAWADVLHLSTKWDISTIRDVAIATIAPLASLVDKLVFGRMYNVQSWVLDALIGMLGRKENLSLEEGRRMQLEDVMAIGVGRREAQILSPTCTPDNKRLRQLVADLYPDEFGHLTYVPSDDDNVTPSTSSAEHQLPNTRPQSISAEREVEATPSQEQIEDIVRWIRLATEPAATEHSVSRACILQYACKYPLHGPTILDQLMKKGIAQFKHSKGSNKYLTAIDQTFELVRLKCTWEEGVYYELARAAALRLLDHWDVLTGKPLTETPAAVVVAENTLPVYEITRFIRHLVDKKIVPITVFSVFWEKLRVLFERSFEKIPSQCPHVIRTVLKKTETQVLTNAACLEIDAFYQAVDQAQKRSEPKIAYALQVGLDSPHIRIPLTCDCRPRSSRSASGRRTSPTDPRLSLPRGNTSRDVFPLCTDNSWIMTSC